MNKLLIILALSATASMSSCSTKEAPADYNSTKENASMSGESKDKMEQSNGNYVTAAHKDPICNMSVAHDAAHYTVVGADTVRFCSESCKTTFDANPAKYNGTPSK